jgi:NCS1 family nucleobase:cation symporter-1
MTFSPSSYNLGASLVSIGLLWWHGMIAAVIGSAILTVLVVLNSRGAIKYFIGFPVYVRAAAGVRGASLYILVRAVVAIIYFATQTYYGGRITSVFMRDFWKWIPQHSQSSPGECRNHFTGPTEFFPVLDRKNSPNLSINLD